MEQRISNYEISQIDEAIINSDLFDNLTELTRKAYVADLRKYNEFIKKRELFVNEESIKLYFRAIKKLYEPATYNRKKYGLLKAFRRLYSGDAVKQNVIEKVIKNKAEKFKVYKAIDRDNILTPVDVKLLIDITKSKKDYRLSVIIYFLWITACRITEMIDIQYKHVTFGKYVKIKIIGKRNKERFIKIPTNLYEIIMEVFKGKKYLFETKNHKKYNRSNLYKQLQRIKVSMIRNPHIFRHSRATFLLNKGFSLKAVSVFLGHSTTGITADFYIHDQPDYDKMFYIDSKNSVY